MKQDFCRSKGSLTGLYVVVSVESDRLICPETRSEIAGRRLGFCWGVEGSTGRSDFAPGKDVAVSDCNSVVRRVRRTKKSTLR